MICKGCGGETSNEEGICNICMLFGSPREYKEQGIDIIVEQEDMIAGKKEIDSEQKEVDEIEEEKNNEKDIEQEDIDDIPRKHILEHLEEQYVGIPRGLYFSNAELNYLNPRTIQSFRQNIPEIIVQDCIKEFNLDDEQAEKLRIILMARGVNKWFHARREFIRLKNQVKDMLKNKEGIYDDKRVHRIIEKIYVKMQNIANTPRWVEWPRTLTHKWKKIEKDIKVKGKHI